MRGQPPVRRGEVRIGRKKLNCVPGLTDFGQPREMSGVSVAYHGVSCWSKMVGPCLVSGFGLLWEGKIQGG